jgi:membrane-bound lytic murein transglycosylase A
VAAAAVGHARAADHRLISDDLDRDSLRLAVQRSLTFLERIPPQRVIGEWPRRVTAGETKESLLLFLAGLESLQSPAALTEWIQSGFALYPVTDAQGGVLFTGYYRPILQASLLPDRRFRFPIYGKPRDLVEAEVVTFLPQRRVDRFVGRTDGDKWLSYFSREEIDRAGRLEGKGYEIAWVDDPIELFFLHIQGSGLLRFANGKLVGVTYAASNGRPYRSIGSVLADSGKIPREEVTMQRLKRYLRDHPEERDALLNLNERYVFFRFVKGEAMGSLEVPLTPGRSIATDARFPRGALAYIVTQAPVIDQAGNHKGWKPLARFVLNQDSGAAIQGPGRVDLYFGTGDLAGEAAGVMKSFGGLFFVLKKRSSGD